MNHFLHCLPSSPANRTAVATRGGTLLRGPTRSQELRLRRPSAAAALSNQNPASFLHHRRYSVYDPTGLPNRAFLQRDRGCCMMQTNLNEPANNAMQQTVRAARPLLSRLRPTSPRKVWGKARARLVPQVTRSVGRPPGRDTGTTMVSRSSRGCWALTSRLCPLKASRGMSQRLLNGGDPESLFTPLASSCPLGPRR